jgi:hypothetical protein
MQPHEATRSRRQESWVCSERDPTPKERIDRKARVASAGRTCPFPLPGRKSPRRGDDIRCRIEQSRLRSTGKDQSDGSIVTVTGGGFVALWAVIYFVLIITLGIMSIRKGHWVMFIIGIFLPFFWLIGALLPPTSNRT